MSVEKVKELSAEEIIQALWHNGPADEIYFYSYETEVTHEQADYIANQTLGCKRLDDEVDSDSEDYDPEEMENIRLSVEDYIDNNLILNMVFVDYFLDIIIPSKVSNEEKSILEDLRVLNRGSNNAN